MPIFLLQVSTIGTKIVIYYVFEIPELSTHEGTSSLSNAVGNVFGSPRIFKKICSNTPVFSIPFYTTNNTATDKTVLFEKPDHYTPIVTQS